MTKVALPTQLTDMHHAEFYPHPVTQLDIIETHISWVILTGEYAYKIKKNLTLDFLDFSSLAQRKHYCEEELRLNKRFAPQLYLSVVRLTSDGQHLSINGRGKTIEYAVKMRQFPKQNQFNHLVERKKLTLAHIEHLAKNLASIHQSLPQAEDSSSFGEYTSIIDAAMDNFASLQTLIKNPELLHQIHSLQHWTQQFAESNTSIFIERKAMGFVRECHGDLHLGNITLLDELPVIFDCIEFNETFRWIDVISDISFLIMDLHYRQQHSHARYLLNLYLEITGDYQGLTLLRFYLVYRAMVRCKIEGIMLQQGRGKQTHLLAYLKLAHAFTQSVSPTLIITHGLSGSGKSIVSQMIVEQSDTLRIRSDVERKRLYGLSRTEKSKPEEKEKIYSAQANAATYDYLSNLAQHVILSGYNVIVDATFLKAAPRRVFYELAKKLNARFLILHTQAPIPILEKWISERLSTGKDVSEATIDILKKQLQNQDPLDENEKKNTLIIQTDQTINLDNILSRLTGVQPENTPPSSGSPK